MRIVLGIVGLTVGLKLGKEIKDFVKIDGMNIPAYSSRKNLERLPRPTPFADSLESDPTLIRRR